MRRRWEAQAWGRGRGRSNSQEQKARRGGTWRDSRPPIVAGTGLLGAHLQMPPCGGYGEPSPPLSGGTSQQCKVLKAPSARCPINLGLRAAREQSHMGTPTSVSPYPDRFVSTAPKPKVGSLLPAKGSAVTWVPLDGEATVLITVGQG